MSDIFQFEAARPVEFQADSSTGDAWIVCVPRYFFTILGEMVYQYFTGPRFRQRVQAIVEALSSMREDLDKEREVIMKPWTQAPEQMERVMGGTIGMYGDLQGTAGKSLQEIEGLELRALELDP